MSDLFGSHIVGFSTRWLICFTGELTDEHGDLQGVQVQNPLAIDPSGVQYQFRANTGQGKLYID